MKKLLRNIKEWQVHSVATFGMLLTFALAYHLGFWDVLKSEGSEGQALLAMGVLGMCGGVVTELLAVYFFNPLYLCDYPELESGD